MTTLAPQTGAAVLLRAHEALDVIAPEGAQVADLAFFAAADHRERFSPGRTLDYNETASLTAGSVLYSNRSRPLARIERDDTGRHDFLLSPCSERMFEILQGVRGHRSCHANLAAALASFGIAPDEIDAAFNAFMTVRWSAGGAIGIEPPSSRPGDTIVFRALEDLVIGIAACSSPRTNDGACKPIAFQTHAAPTNGSD